jgi:hypothetical protein
MSEKARIMEANPPTMLGSMLGLLCHMIIETASVPPAIIPETIPQIRIILFIVFSF